MGYCYTINVTLFYFFIFIYVYNTRNCGNPLRQTNTRLGLNEWVTLADHLLSPALVGNIL